MLKHQFHLLLNQFPDLSPQQRQQAIYRLAGHQSNDELFQRFEQQQADAHVCPHCQHDRFHRWGTCNGLQRYRCRRCKKTYTALTHTPLYRMKMRDKWLMYVETMLLSKPLRYAAAKCGISLDTSFRWRHRFISLVDSLNADELSGIVEIDETFIRESFKGKRGPLGRKPRKRGGQHKGEAKWVPVLVARDRNKAVADFVMPDMSIDEVEARLLPLLPRDGVLCSDGHMSYEALAKRHGFKHKALNASQGIRVLEQAYHIQGVNSYHQRLKGWLQPFRGVATKYLHRYLGWFRWFEQHSALSNTQPVDFAWDCMSPCKFQQQT